MKLSEATLASVKLAMRIDYDLDDSLIGSIMEAAKGYIRTYTGLTDSRLDDYPEVIHAFYCLCIDMYDNRSVEIANGRENPTVKQILGGIAVNYL